MIMNKNEKLKLCNNYGIDDIDIMKKLSKDEDVEIRELVAENPNTSADILDELANDFDYMVRMKVCHNLNTPINTLLTLSNDKNISVRESVSANENTPKEILEKLYSEGTNEILINLAYNKSTPTFILEKLSEYELKDENDELKEALKENPSLPKHCYNILTNKIKNPNNSSDKTKKLFEYIKRYEHFPDDFEIDYKEFFDDEEFMLKCIEYNQTKFKLASKRLQSDTSFIKKALKVNGSAIRFLDKEYKNSIEYIKIALEENGKAIHWIPKKFKKNLDLIGISLKTSHKAYEYLDDEKKRDTELIIKSLKSGLELKHIPEDIRFTDIFIKEYIRFYSAGIAVARYEELRNNIDLGIKSILESPFHYKEYLTDEFKNSKEFIIKLSNKLKWNELLPILISINKNLLKDKDIKKIFIEVLKYAKENLTPTNFNKQVLTIMYKLFENDKDFSNTLKEYDMNTFNNELPLNEINDKNKALEIVTKKFSDIVHLSNFNKDIDFIMLAMDIFIDKFEEEMKNENELKKRYNRTENYNLIHDILDKDILSNPTFHDYISDKAWVFMYTFKPYTNNKNTALKIIKLYAEEFTFQRNKTKVHQFNSANHTRPYLEYIDNSLFKDKEFMLIVSKILNEIYIDNEEFIEDKEFMKSILLNCEVEFEKKLQDKVRELFNDKQLVLELVNNNLIIIDKNIPIDLRSNKEFILNVIRIDKSLVNFNDLSKKLKDDSDISKYFK